MILTEREAFIWPSKFCSIRNKFLHLKHKELQYPVDRKYMYTYVLVEFYACLCS